MVRVYRPGPRRRGLRICGKPVLLADEGASCRISTLCRRANSRSTRALALGHIVLARDAAAISKPNGGVTLVVNSCAVAGRMAVMVHAGGCLLALLNGAYSAGGLSQLPPWCVQL